MHMLRPLVVLASIVAVVTSACATGTPSGSPQTQSLTPAPSQVASPTASPAEISFLVFETPNLTADYWDKAIKRFTDKHPNITVTKITSPDIDRTKYAKQLLATGQFPDVFIALNVAEFAESGALLALPEDRLQDFMQPMAGAVDGKQLLTPWGSQAIPLIYYNADVFEQLGLSEPNNWAEFLALAETIKGAGKTALLAGGGNAPWASSILLDGIISVDVLGTQPDWLSRRKPARSSSLTRCSRPPFRSGWIWSSGAT